MSGDPSDEELEKLRQEKMEQLQEQGGQQGQGVDEEAMEAQREQREAQKKAMLRKHLTDGARKRLNTVQMSKPEFGDQVEQQVLALAQSGRIQGKIDEEKMKELLKQLQPEKKSFDIQRR